MFWQLNYSVLAIYSTRWEIIYWVAVLCRSWLLQEKWHVFSMENSRLLFKNVSLHPHPNPIPTPKKCTNVKHWSRNMVNNGNVDLQPNPPRPIPNQQKRRKKIGVGLGVGGWKGKQKRKEERKELGGGGEKEKEKEKERETNPQICNRKYDECSFPSCKHLIYSSINQTPAIGGDSSTITSALIGVSFRTADPGLNSPRQ